MLGKQSGGIFSFIRNGGVASTMDSIFPIGTTDKNDIFSLSGTGFYISHNGIFVTAQHVAMTALEEKLGIPALGNLAPKQYSQIKGLNIMHMTEDGRYTIRPVSKLFCLNRSASSYKDIAVGFAAQMSDPLGNSLTVRDSLPLTAEIPQNGEAIYTYSFCDYTAEESDSVSKRIFNPGFYAGSFLKQDKDRNAAGMPCCMLKMHVHGGSSGAPIFNSKGAIWGICSQSDMVDVSNAWATPLKEILSLKLKDGTDRSATVKQLIEEGILNIEGL